jgi:hypothetical protein
MTKREMLTMISEMHADNAEIVNFCNHEIEFLNKKSSSKKPTRKQIENEHYKDIILNILANSDHPLAIKDLQSMNEELENLSNQRLSAILTTLKNNEKIIRTVERGLVYFAYND